MILIDFPPVSSPLAWLSCVFFSVIFVDSLHGKAEIVQVSNVAFHATDCCFAKSKSHWEKKNAQMFLSLASMNWGFPVMVNAPHGHCCKGISLPTLCQTSGHQASYLTEERWEPESPKDRISWFSLLQFPV